MSGAKHIKQAIIASLCDHPDAEIYVKRAFSDHLDTVMEAMAKERQYLTKADFLTTTDDNGKLMIDSGRAWKNFDKILRAIHSNGDRLTYQDFTNPLFFDKRTRSLLEIAEAHYSLNIVFTADVWQGRFEEMERLWFKLPCPTRIDTGKNQGLIPADIKRKVFAAAGRTTPEDRLANAGFSLSLIAEAFMAGGSVQETNARLKRAGDYLRKEYVMLPDSSGDTLFYRSSSWEKFEALLGILKENGERFEVADYIHQISLTKSILGRAAEHKALNAVFKADHWVGRLPDMLELWSKHVLEGWRVPPMTSRDFDNAYAEAESRTYFDAFQASSVTGKADLLKPLTPVCANEKPVLPLGLKTVWDNFDAIQAHLAQQGERLSLSDLRTISGQRQESCLISAVKAGHFKKAIDVVKKNGEAITLDDFLSRDSQGNTLIDVLAEKKQLSLAFAPEMWAGRLQDMRALWSNVALAQRQQIDFQSMEVRAKQETLKQKKPAIFKLQPPKK